MKHLKQYEAKDKMIALIRDNYNVLQSLGSFGINLGFGDKTVEEVCQEHGVDTCTFLAIVNYTVNGELNQKESGPLSISTLMKYLQASHDYFLGFQLPSTRQELAEALNTQHETSEQGNLDSLILKLYDDYARAITLHMRYEEKMVFPYVEGLLNGVASGKYNVDTYSKHHGQESERLRELKGILIRYLPGNGLHSQKLLAVLYRIYNNEDWLRLHAEVEERFFMPAIRLLEQQLVKENVTAKISSMVNAGSTPEGYSDQLSEREKEVIVALVQGMSNKEIAAHLHISLNTALTHRRNIAAKLQIHSPAGLTIYAIVNKLIDLEDLTT
ncbi:MAG: LuxR C-terminal-related transcriptional regulator [Bacteroides sp.]